GPRAVMVRCSAQGAEPRTMRPRASVRPSRLARYARSHLRTTVWRRRRSGAAALLGDSVVVAAFQCDPVGYQILGARQVLGPRIARHQSRSLPYHVELAVRTHLADKHWLGDVVVGQHGGHAAGEIGRLD